MPISDNFTVYDSEKAIQRPKEDPTALALFRKAIDDEQFAIKLLQDQSTYSKLIDRDTTKALGNYPGFSQVFNETTFKSYFYQISRCHPATVALLRENKELLSALPETERAFISPNKEVPFSHILAAR